MQEQLYLLDKHLHTARPDFYTQLNDPLTVSEINALEQKFNMQFPADIKALYQWKNGQRHDCYTTFIKNSTFMPLQDALESAAELTSMIGYDFEIENWWNKQWIPVFCNGGGDHICYDLEGTFTGEPGQMIEFWHADNYRKIIAPALQVFIEAINHYYENTSPADFDEFFVPKKEIAGFPKEFILS